MIHVHTPIARRTMTTDVQRRPSLVAVIVVEPLACAVTSPVADTVPTRGSLCAHVTSRPERTWPSASQVAAVSYTVAPTTSSVVTGTIVTSATGWGGEVDVHATSSRADVRSGINLRVDGAVIGPPGR